MNPLFRQVDVNEPSSVPFCWCDATVVSVLRNMNECVLFWPIKGPKRWWRLLVLRLFRPLSLSLPPLWRPLHFFVISFVPQPALPLPPCVSLPSVHSLFFFQTVGVFLTLSRQAYLVLYWNANYMLGNVFGLSLSSSFEGEMLTRFPPSPLTPPSSPSALLPRLLHSSTANWDQAIEGVDSWWAEIEAQWRVGVWELRHSSRCLISPTAKKSH